MVSNGRFVQICSHVLLMVLSLVCVFPIVLLIVSSITPEITLIQNGYTFFPTKVDFLAYQYLFTSSQAVIRAYVITIFVTVVGTVVNVCLTTMIAYPLSRRDLPARNVIMFAVFFTMLFSGGLVPSYIMWTQVFHIKNTIWALIVPTLLLSPFNVILMRTYFATSIPEEVIDSSRIDGASEGLVLRKIVLPMSLPIMATVALFAGLAYWNDWMNGFYYLTDQRLFSVQVLLNKMLQDAQFLQTTASQAGVAALQVPSTALRMAIAVIGVLPMLIIYPFFQRFFIKGLTIGAVKG